MRDTHFSLWCLNLPHILYYIGISLWNDLSTLQKYTSQCIFSMYYTLWKFIMIQEFLVLLKWIFILHCRHETECHITYTTIWVILFIHSGLVKSILQTHSYYAHSMFLKRHTFQNSCPVDHMKISTHPKEPLHFLRTSRPTVWPLLHQRKSSVVDDSAEIYFGSRRRNGNKCVAQVQASIFRLHTIHNLGLLKQDYFG